jgi:hypothetical protein
MGKQGNCSSVSGLLLETFPKKVTCQLACTEVRRTIEGTRQTKYLSAHALQTVLILMAIGQ